jgi:cell division protein FtsL
MNSIAATPLLRPIKITLFSLIIIACSALAVRYIYPHFAERQAATEIHGKLNSDINSLENQITAVRKNRTELQGNNRTLLKHIGHREDLIDPNEKVFYFPEPAAGKKP